MTALIPAVDTIMRWQCYIYIIFLVSSSVGLKCCRRPNPLIINGTDIFNKAEGSQLLVAFVEGGNKHSRKQIRVLDLLMDNFLNMDIKDIVFMGINKKHDKNIDQLKRRAENYQIFQEPSTSDLWEKFGVRTNDFMIFDHCGYLVGYMCYPKNLLLEESGRVCTDRVIRDTYRESPCAHLWTCLNKNPTTPSTEPPEETAEKSGKSKWFPFFEPNEGTLNVPRNDLASLQDILLKDESDEM